jgi:hypothetical protein
MPKFSCPEPSWTDRVAFLQPEYAPVKTAAIVFGLSRTELWRLMDEGQITWVHYKSNPTATKGVRLIKLSSLRDHIQSFAK